MEGVNPKKWDVRKLQGSKEIKQVYHRKIEERIGENREEGNVQEKWKRIEKVINEVADEAVGKEENQSNKEWFDEECAKLISEKNGDREIMLKRETRANYEVYQELRWKANRICKKKKKKRMRK
jgi:hypothetical protein